MHGSHNVFPYFHIQLLSMMNLLGFFNPTRGTGQGDISFWHDNWIENKTPIEIMGIDEASNLKAKVYDFITEQNNGTYPASCNSSKNFKK